MNSIEDTLLSSKITHADYYKGYYDGMEADMPAEVKEIIEELEKAVEPNDCGQGIVFAIQTIKAKYGIDDCEAYGVKRETIKPIPVGDWRLN